MRDNHWHFRNFYWIFVVFFIIVVIGIWKCCDQASPGCPETDCFPGERAWSFGPTEDNPLVLPEGGELILSKAVSGDGWRAYIKFNNSTEPDVPVFICEDTDGLSGGEFDCEDDDSALKVWKEDYANCENECCIRYELCLGDGCDDDTGERGSDGGGNSGHI
jgi:hypothetical protein